MAYSIHTYAGVNGALKSRLNRESETLPICRTRLVWSASVTS